MFKRLLVMAVAGALVAAHAAPALAQAAAEKSDKAAKTAKKLTPQQQKMKDCGPKWQEYKKANNVKGQAEYRKFLKTCLKS